jgi:hypothetical protein
MSFDESMIADLPDVASMLNGDEKLYLDRLEVLANDYVGKEHYLEDIIYDFEDTPVRMEAMMVCKLMPNMERKRIYQDLLLAEKDPELKKWAGILFRQENVLETASQFNSRKKGRSLAK